MSMKFWISACCVSRRCSSIAERIVKLLHSERCRTQEKKEANGYGWVSLLQVDQVVASLEEMQCTIAGSLRQRRNRPRSSIKRTRYERLNEAKGKKKIEATSWEEEQEEPNHHRSSLMLDPGAWRNWSPAAKEVHDIVMEILIASRFAKKLATFVAADATLHKESSRSTCSALHRFKILFPREEAPATKACFSSRAQAAATRTRDRPLLLKEVQLVSPSPPTLLLKKHHGPSSALDKYDEREKHLQQQQIGLCSALLGGAPFKGLCKARHGWTMFMTRQIVTNKLCNVPEATMTQIESSNCKPWKPRYSCKGMMPRSSSSSSSSSSLPFPAANLHMGDQAGHKLCAVNLHMGNQAGHKLCDKQSAQQSIKGPGSDTTKLVMDDPSPKMNQQLKLQQPDQRNNKLQGMIRMLRRSRSMSSSSSSATSVETSVQPSMQISQVVADLVNGKQNSAHLTTTGSHKTSGMWLLRSWSGQSLLHCSSSVKTTSGTVLHQD